MMSAGASQYGDARPQRVGCGRMCATDRGVQKQIRLTMPSQMLWFRRDLREHETRWIDTALVCFRLQIQYDRVMNHDKPQLAVGYGDENLHPNVKNLRLNLVVVVERGKDETVFRESALRTVHRGLTAPAGAVPALRAYRLV